MMSLNYGGKPIQEQIHSNVEIKVLQALEAYELRKMNVKLNYTKFLMKENIPLKN
jgi:hypothetical protein